MKERKNAWMKGPRTAAAVASAILAIGSAQAYAEDTRAIDYQFAGPTGTVTYNDSYSGLPMVWGSRDISATSDRVQPGDAPDFSRDFYIELGDKRLWYVASSKDITVRAGSAKNNYVNVHLDAGKLYLTAWVSEAGAGCTGGDDSHDCEDNSYEALSDIKTLGDGRAILGGGADISETLKNIANDSVSTGTLTAGNSTVNGHSQVNGDTTTTGNTNTGSLTVGGDSSTGGNSTVGGKETAGSLETKGDATIGGNETVAGNSEVKGDSKTGGDGSVGGDLDVGGNASVAGNTTVGTEGTPSELVVHGGTTTDSLVVNGTADVASDTTVGGDLTVKGDGNVGGDLTVTGSETVGKDLTVGKTVVIGDPGSNDGKLTVNGTADVASDAAVRGNLGVSGDSNVGGDLAVSGSGTFGNGLTIGKTVVIGDAEAKDGSLTVNGTADVASDASVGGDLAVAGSVRASGDGTFDSIRARNDAEIGRDLRVSGSGSVEGDFRVGKNVVIGDPEAKDGTLSVNGTADVASDAHVQGNVTIGTPEAPSDLSVSGSARIGKSLTLGDPDANDGSLAVNGSATVSGNSVTLGSGFFGDSLTVGSDPATRAVIDGTKGTMSLGSSLRFDGATGRITGVAPGEISRRSTDAVNGSQLWGLRNSLGEEIAKVGASSSAIAALHPQDYDEGHPFSAAVGLGHYKSREAVAVGAFYRPTPNLLLSAAYSASASDSHMANLGLSYRFGGPALKATPVALEGTVREQSVEIRDLTSQIAALETRNAALVERLEALEAKAGLVPAPAAE